MPEITVTEFTFILWISVSLIVSIILYIIWLVIGAFFEDRTRYVRRRAVDKVERLGRK